jgi:translation initiation factor 2D
LALVILYPLNMFAKPQKTSGNSLLKNKDVKKFRKDLSLYARDAVSDEQLQTLIPNKATIKKQSFQAPSRMVVYVNEDTREPLAFDETGKGDAMCASVYALWRLSALLPRLEVHAPVSEFVLRGADVMLPGVVFTSLEEVQALRKGELRAVFARGNPHAFAVGELLVDAEDIQKHGKKGKGLRVLHYYGDELWKMGPQTAPNPGFPGLASGSEKVVIKAIGAAAEDSDEEHEEVAEAGVDLSGVSLEVDESEELEEKKEITQTEGDDDGETTPVVTKEEMDVLYYQSLLQVMRSGRLKDKHLPMLASTFHATVLLPCRPAGSSLNIKQSSHKKLSTFLKAMAAKGFLSVSDKDGVQSITAIGPRHPYVFEYGSVVYEWIISQCMLLFAETQQHTRCIARLKTRIGKLTQPDCSVPTAARLRLHPERMHLRCKNSWVSPSN